MKGPTQRTLEECRRLGWVAGVVEKWIPQTRRRADLWGWCDVVALSPGALVFIQCTSGSNHASRAQKVAEWAHLPDLERAGGRAEVWSWAKRVVRRADGSKAKRKQWALRRELVLAHSETVTKEVA
ncbi:MAG: hypothetical protein VW405_13165 [Rhodospirillaceae bacterium]